LTGITLLNAFVEIGEFFSAFYNYKRCELPR